MGSISCLNILKRCSLVAGITIFFCFFIISAPKVYSEILSYDYTTLSTKKVEKVSQNNYPESINIVMDKSGKPWWIEILVALIGAIISASLIVWQIGRQYKNSINLQRENHQNQFKLKIYQELAPLIDKAAAKVQIGIIGMMLPDKIAKTSGSYPEIQERPLDIANGTAEFIIEVTKLMCFIETYEVVMPRFRIFRLAFACSTDELQKVSHKYFIMLLKFLPIDLTEEEVKKLGIKALPNVKPNNNELEKLREIGDKYLHECLKIYSYIKDLSIEAQKELLGNIFGRDVHSRIQIEAKHKVISTDNTKLAELEKYFYENTEFGKKWAQFTENNKS